MPLSHPLDEPLTLVVGGTATHKARIGRKNRRLAVRIDAKADPQAVQMPAKPLMLVKGGERHHTHA